MDEQRNTDCLRGAGGDLLFLRCNLSESSTAQIGGVLKVKPLLFPDRQRDGQTERQTNRQKDRQTDIQADRERERESVCVCV